MSIATTTLRDRALAAWREEQEAQERKQQEQRRGQEDELRRRINVLVGKEWLLDAFPGRWVEANDCNGEELGNIPVVDLDGMTIGFVNHATLGGLWLLCWESTNTFDGPITNLASLGSMLVYRQEIEEREAARPLVPCTFCGGDPGKIIPYTLGAALCHVCGGKGMVKK